MELRNKFLGSIITFKNGKKRPSEEGTIPVYGGNGILGYTNKNNNENCIAIGRVGAYCGSVYYEPNKCWISDNAICAIPKEDINIYYALYLLKGLHLNRRHIGTGQPLLTQEILNNIECQIPDLKVQDKIARFLQTIDNKISINITINKNLEEQAQALFKAWFVDFEPFGGKLPSDWIIGKLGDVVDISTKAFNPNKSDTVKIEHYSIPAYDDKHYPVFECSDVIKSNKYYVNKTSVIISKLNPDTKRIWRPYCITNIPICSTEFIVYQPQNEQYRDWIYSIIDSDQFNKHLCSHVVGSTNSRQRAVPKATLDFEIVVPQEKIIKEFCSIVTPIYDMIEKNIISNQELAQLRDALLPKLMSGELDVSEIDI